MTSPTAPRPFAVVTGASSGIGLELARQFHDNGYDVLIVAEDAGIAAAARELDPAGTSVTSAQVDLSSYDGVESLWSRVDRPVDAIAINAGIGVGGRFAETDLAKELAIVNLNVTSSVHLAKRAVTAMVARGEGRILFTSSIASTMPGPYEAVYAASKSFVQSFAEALHTELKDDGVTVTALMPGPTETNFFQRADLEDTKLGQMKNKDDAALVAKQGFEALMKGERKVVAGGVKTKVQAATNVVLPDAAKAKAHAAQAKPGSGD